jgi:hypothetical protein
MTRLPSGTRGDGLHMLTGIDETSAPEAKSSLMEIGTGAA